MWGNNKILTEKKKRYTRTSRPKKREKTNYSNFNTVTVRQTYVELETATLFHRTEKMHKITDKNNQRFEEIQLLFFRDKE